MDKTRSRKRKAEIEKSPEIKAASKKVEKEIDDESEGEIEDNSSDEGEGSEDSDYEEMKEVEDGEGGSDSDDSGTNSGGTRKENVDPDVIIRWMPDDKYRELLVGKYGPEIAEEDAFFDEDLWKEADGGVEKGRLYGQGSSDIFPARARASAASSAASTSSLEDRIRTRVREEMREEMEKQVEERLAAMKKERDEEMKKRDEEMKKRDEQMKKQDEQMKKQDEKIDALMKHLNVTID